MLSVGNKEEKVDSGGPIWTPMAGGMAEREGFELRR